MSSKTILVFNLALIALVGTLSCSAHAATETTLYSFRDGLSGDGRNPAAGLVFDRQGNLYGTTTGGGQYAYGTLFQLSPIGSGGWKETVLHDFGGTSQDGKEPVGNLAIDANGNLYGATQYGGDTHGFGAGSIYEASQNPDGTWSETVLFGFTDCHTGCSPAAGPVLDAAGNLYGTTSAGQGAASFGTVFELTPNSGTWTQTVLYNFRGTPSDGAAPAAELIFDSHGNLYGTTASGGNSSCPGCGTVFRLAHSKKFWRESVLHFFQGGKDGYTPRMAPLTIDARGRLYGTTPLGGGRRCHKTGCGTVFQLRHTLNGWSERVIYAFPNTGTTVHPYGGLILDAAGNLFGTTSVDLGGVFELSPPQFGGKWQMTALWNFTGGSDGLIPLDGLIADPQGNLYGTTYSGGDSELGTVFEIVR